MKYAYQEETIPQDKRKILNEKVLYLIDNDRVMPAPSVRKISIMPIQAMAGFTDWNGRTMKITMNTVKPKRD